MLVIKKNTKPHQRLWGSGLMTFFPSYMQASRRVVLLLMKWLWFQSLWGGSVDVCWSWLGSSFIWDSSAAPRLSSLAMCLLCLMGGRAFHQYCIPWWFIKCTLAGHVLSLLLLVFWRLTIFILGCIRTIGDFVHGVTLIGWCLTA